MRHHDPRVDDYIARAAPFAQPILAELRERVHAGCAEAEETIKWGMPFFVFRGTPLCHMAAFKQHAAFGFWRGRDVVDAPADEGMGQLGKLASVKDLPARAAFARYMKEAVSRIAAGARPARPRAAPKPPPVLPDDVAALLAQKKHAAAKRAYDGFSPSQRRDYVEWIAEAKTEATRARRVATMLEWLAAGRTRNWKYEK